MKLKTICCYCNTETKNKKPWHMRCIIDDIYDTIYKGEKITHRQYDGARYYNISIKELRNEVQEDKNGKIKDI